MFRSERDWSRLVDEGSIARGTVVCYPRCGLLGSAAVSWSRKRVITLTQADFDAIADKLNGRPRQTLGFKTPSQALAEVLR